MSDNQYKYPVQRIGNEKNPKLVILFCNPGGDTTYIKRLSDYTMDKDGVYKKSGNNFATVRQYEPFWDDILYTAEKHGIKDSDILVLEYYMYHTYKQSDFPHNKKYWTTEAIDALDDNKKLLEKFMQENTPVYGFYWGLWHKDIPNLPNHKNYCYYEKRNWSKKIDTLDRFLSKIIKK